MKTIAKYKKYQIYSYSIWQAQRDFSTFFRLHFSNDKAFCGIRNPIMCFVVEFSFRLFL
jgi:hypothetical protein